MPQHTTGRADPGNEPSTRYTALSNLLYDVCTILSEKSAGLEVLDAYIQDAEEEGDDEVRQVFERMVQHDQEIVTELQRHLGRLANASQRSAGR